MTLNTQQDLARYFDHTLLGAGAVEADIRRLCQEARHYGFFGVCVQPRWVELCADLLSSSAVKVVSVAGFPFGTETHDILRRQIEALIHNGADEVDIVADQASVLTGDAAYLRRQFAVAVKACRVMRPAALLKIIIESAALTGEQIDFVCALAQEAGADFVKTSTGFHPAGGADADDVRRMAQAAPRCGVKAAGGIKTLQQALAMIEAGATRIGASASTAILDAFGTDENAAD